MKKFVLACVVIVIVTLVFTPLVILKLGLFRPTQPKVKPNFVVILTDDLDLASMDQLPGLTSLLGDEGATFSNYFVSLSLCCPSRATMLCGKYAHNTNIFDNRPPNGGYKTFHDAGAEDSTLAVWLQQAGYRTGLLGKYLNGYPGKEGEAEIPPGWSDWAVPVKGNPYKDYDYSLNENGVTVAYGQEPDDYLTTVITNKAEDYIVESSKNDQPFFLLLSPFVPHSPATPPPDYKGAFSGLLAPRTPAFNEADVSDKLSWIQERAPLTQDQINAIDLEYRKRLQTMLGIQDMVDSVIKTLAANGELDNTYIIFTSDNGYHLGEHRYTTGKNSAFDTDLHVPFIIRGPGIKPGTVIDQIASNVDIAPTVADLAGVISASDVDGRSLAPLLSGPVKTWRQALLLEHGGPLEGNEVTGTSLNEPPDADAIATGKKMPAFIGVRTAEYTYVSYADGQEELYNDLEDPYQLENIASSADPALIASLKDLATKLSTCQGDTCRALED